MGGAIVGKNQKRHVRLVGGCEYYAPLSWERGGTNGKDPIHYVALQRGCVNCWAGVLAAKTENGKDAKSFFVLPFVNRMTRDNRGVIFVGAVIRKSWYLYGGGGGGSAVSLRQWRGNTLNDHWKKAEGL